MGKREAATDEVAVVAAVAALRRSVSSKESVDATDGMRLLLGLPLIVRGTCRIHKWAFRGIATRANVDPLLKVANAKPLLKVANAEPLFKGTRAAPKRGSSSVARVSEANACSRGQSRAFMPWISSVAHKHYRCTSISD